MKNSLQSSVALIGMSITIVCTATGQTNTFPSSGDVGIGTTSPSQYLDIEGGSLLVNGFNYGGNGLLLRGAGVSAQNVSVLTTNFFYSGDYDGLQINGYRGIEFTTNNGATVPMVITNGGNVGIGTTSPSYGLDVVGPSSSYTMRLGTPDGGDAIFSMTGAGYQLFSVRTASNAYVSINTQNSAMLGLGVSTDATPGSITNTLNLTAAGNVGIGTTDPAYPLSVNGTVEAKEVIVQTGWSDYVFDKGYHLAPLSEVERTIKAQQHLPGMPSAKDVAAHGVSLGDMQAKLLAQVEEVTLHQIEQEKLIEEQTLEIKELERKVKSMQNDNH